MLLAAPTGSGKTVIAANALEELTDRTNALYIWITPGKGDLSNQSLNALAAVSSKLNLVQLSADSTKKLSLNDVFDNTIIVANWEYLWSTKSGALPNYKQARDGEAALIDVIKFAKQSGVKVVLIVDESHHGTDGTITKEMLSELSPDLRIDISATPKNNSYDVSHVIDYDVVASSGAIKPTIAINYELSTKPCNGDDAINVLYLRSALERLLKVEHVARTNIVGYNPLLLVQIENADAKSSDAANLDIIDTVIKEYSISQHECAIWSDGSPRTLNGAVLHNRDVLQENSAIRVLVFKQAISLGWDCPRASILMQFRKTTNKSFQLQLIGRILRMPSQVRHCHNVAKELITAYVYSYFNANASVPPVLDYANAGESLIYTKRSYTFNVLGLEKTEIVNEDEVSDAQNELTAIEEVVKALNITGLNLNEPTFEESVLTDATMDLTHVSKNLSASSTIKLIDDKSIYANLANRIESDFRRFSRGWIKEILIPALCKVCKPSAIPQGISVNTYVHAMLYENYNQIHPYINNLNIDGVCTNKLFTKEFKQVIWNPPEAMLVPDTFKAKSRYLYDNAPDNWSLSKPEQAFIEALLTGKLATIQNNGFVLKWWWKNGDSGADYFSIGYQLPTGEKHLFYPDFLVYGHENIGGKQTPKLFIIETKDSTQHYGSPALDPVNGIKYIALKDWESQNNPTSGMSISTELVCVTPNNNNMASSLFKTFDGKAF